jgi:hypothetical protein
VAALGEDDEAVAAIADVLEFGDDAEHGRDAGAGGVA